MTENMQVYDAQSRQAVVVRCCLNYYNIFLTDLQQFFCKSGEIFFTEPKRFDKAVCICYNK